MKACKPTWLGHILYDWSAKDNSLDLWVEESNTQATLTTTLRPDSFLPPTPCPSPSPPPPKPTLARPHNCHRVVFKPFEKYPYSALNLGYDHEQQEISASS